MKFTPFGRNIYVKPRQEKRALGDVSLTEYGDVVEIGDEVTKVKKGDVIGFTVFGVNHLEINGEKLYIIPETDEFILGFLELAEEPVQGGLAA